MSLTALEWGLRAPITPRFGGNLWALPRLQETRPKQQKKTDLKHKTSDGSWNCRLLSEKFASTSGVRTLDALHAAVARLSGAEEFVTSDSRQSNLAARIGLIVIDPTRRGRGK